MLRSVGFACALVCAALSSAKAAEDCKLHRVGVMDMIVDQEGVAVMVTINGTPEKLAVDTGGTYSMLRASVAQSLGLSTKPIDTERMRMTGVGGKVVKDMTVASNVMFGNMPAKEFAFVIAPDDKDMGDAAGTIGPEILANFDADFDIAGHKLTLFSPDHCPGKVVYWTKDPVAIVPMEQNKLGQFEIDVTLDGQSLDAKVDTGSTISWMSYETARSLFGWHDDDPKLKFINDREGYRYPFASLELQGIAITHPVINLPKDATIGIDLSNDKMLIGMNILRHLHFYIAYHENNLYLTAADAH
jgi:predicted aspartyl protease